MPLETNPFPTDSPIYPIASELLARTTLPLLPKVPHSAEIRARLHSQPVLDAASTNTLAVLHLLNDDIETAHRLVQAHEENQTSNYIHAIMHRLEGDYSNARYWMRRVGTHPLYATLKMPDGSPWHANEFVTAVEDTENTKAAVASRAELHALLHWCLENNA